MVLVMTDVHYQIIRIPFHLQPIEKGLKHCREVLHHMDNIIRGKAIEITICPIIRYHNDTLHRVNFFYKNMIDNLPEAPFTPHGSKKKPFINLLFGIVGTSFGVANRKQDCKNQHHNCQEHTPNGHAG